MTLKWIAAALAALLLCGPAFGQNGDGSDGPRDRREPREPRFEQGGARFAPGVDRRQRIDRPEPRFEPRRERRERAGVPRRTGGDIYRRSNNYRRW